MTRVGCQERPDQGQKGAEDRDEPPCRPRGVPTPIRLPHQQPEIEAAGVDQQRA